MNQEETQQIGIRLEKELVEDLKESCPKGLKYTDYIRMILYNHIEREKVKE